MLKFRHAVCVMLPAFAFSAEDTRARDDESIDEIQVTATRRPLSTSRVAASVTVIDRDGIAARTLATDALAAQPGVFLQQTTTGQGAAIIRGLKGSEILHLVDGLRLNNAIFRNAPTQYLALIAPGSIERMEIVRGSPTSLYGSDALGGVIQVISRLPEFTGSAVEWRREVALDADSAELRRSVRASLEAGNDRLGGLVSMASQSTGNRRTGAGTRIAPSGFESSSVRAAALLRPTDTASWLVDWQFTRQPETPRTDELVPGFGQQQPSSSEFYFAPNERHFLHLRHAREQGPLSADWTVDLGWQRIVDDRRNRNFAEAVRRIEKNSSDLLGLSVTAARESGSRSWIAGMEVYHDTVHSSRRELDLASGSDSAVESRFPDGATVAQAGLFAHVSQPLGTRHTLSGGLRLSAVDIELPATGLSPPAELRIEDTSADAGWIMELGDRVQLAATAGYGFRAPNVFDLGTLGARPGNRFNVPNPSLKSERVVHYDLAVRAHSAAWQAELAVYELDYTDRIQSVLTGEMTSDGRDVVQSRNLGRAQLHGVEAGLQWLGHERLEAGLLVNYTHGRQREDGGGTVPGDRIPPLNGRLHAAWNLRENLRLRVAAIFAGAQDRLSPRDVRDSRIDPAGTPGWTSVDAGLSWQANATWHIDAGIDNILDHRYRLHGSGIDAPGRNVYLSVRAAW
ncbi:MAG TPA: TonB-dependent receptor [Woeseiaceae bacterium]|nr:TonB-dependent receptor [Woeseiaceae bacterium]